MVSVGCGAGVHRDIVAASDEENGRNWEREEEETVHGSPTNLARTQTGIRLSRDVIGHCSRSVHTLRTCPLVLLPSPMQEHNWLLAVGVQTRISNGGQRCAKTRNKNTPKYQYISIFASTTSPYTLIVSVSLSKSAPTRLASSSANVAFPSIVNASVIDGKVVAP